MYFNNTSSLPTSDTNAKSCAPVYKFRNGYSPSERQGSPFADHRCASQTVLSIAYSRLDNRKDLLVSPEEHRC